MHRTILCLLLASFIGCASTPATRPDYCLDQKSYIYDLAEQMQLHPETVSSMLIIANFEALKHSPLYTVDACRGAIQNIRLLLSSGAPSYYEVITLVSANVDYINRYAGAEIMLLGLFVPQLCYKVSITECDRQLMLAHLDRQEAMLTTFFSGKSS
jgi:hypothetical protein